MIKMCFSHIAGFHLESLFTLQIQLLLTSESGAVTFLYSLNSRTTKVNMKDAEIKVLN